MRAPPKRAHPLSVSIAFSCSGGSLTLSLSNSLSTSITFFGSELTNEADDLQIYYGAKSEHKLRCLKVISFVRLSLIDAGANGVKLFQCALDEHLSTSNTLVCNTLNAALGQVICSHFASFSPPLTVLMAAELGVHAGGQGLPSGRSGHAQYAGNLLCLSGIHVHPRGAVCLCRLPVESAGDSARAGLPAASERHGSVRDRGR
jgi:hypothetical protein